MPTNLVKGKKAEHLWSRAKAIAAKEGHKNNWAYIVGIFEKMKRS